MPPGTALAIGRFGLTTPDAARLAAFYESAFGCRRLSSTRLAGAAFERLLEVQGGARRILLQGGASIIELLEFDRPGAPYPAHTSVAHTVFQHFAWVVGDIARAFTRLAAVPGWTPISRDGPERLPASSGGVRAFKFRDPDGHPLELLEFPAGGRPIAWRDAGGEGVFGIDHSAISVADVKRSIGFYRTLGFTVAATTVNHGIEQARLDGMDDPRVDVVALAPRAPTPHLELLAYHERALAGDAAIHSNDVAASRLILECDLADPLTAPDASLIRDPDGHRIVLQRC